MSVNTTTINNFDLTKGLGPACYLGINLDPTSRIALTESIEANVWGDSGFSVSGLAGLTSRIPEGTDKLYLLMPGTQQLADFLVDAHLAVTKNARAQAANESTLKKTANDPAFRSVA